MFKIQAALVCFVAIAIVANQATPAGYTSKYDNIDIDAILNNDRLLDNYFKCLMETGKCSPEGGELKRLLPEAIENKCVDCTEKQRQGSEKAIKFMFEKKNDMWKELEAKYDPQGSYRQRYNEDAKKLNIETNN